MLFLCLFDMLLTVNRLLLIVSLMLELKADARTILGKKVNSLRKTGLIPAILYGHGKKPATISVNAREFDKIFKQAGETTLLSLVLDGKKHNVFIHDQARDSLSGQITHLDFFEVNMDEKIKARVQFVFIGESPAVKADGGVLVRAMQEIEIEALPKDLPKEIMIDISSLATFEDKIHIKDLKLSGGIRILTNLNETIALVAPPRSDKEMEELETKPVEAAVSEVKVVGEEAKAAAAAETGQEEAK
ncbi:MAG: 50S ribosomal protein L25 [Parcubacteria group bacterium GW2011_GWA2_43_9b]|nr:MAG: 50S ribosomal protein L25 [Parcubacteria group bacterium GW2011_GWA2_43_9b]